MRATTTLQPAHQEQTNLPCGEERLRDELEVVSYVTSHDLQSPLRIIEHCGEELRRNAALMADAAARKEMETLLHETARLKALMQGMLDDVRLEIFPVMHAELDSNDIVRVAIATLEPEIKAANATIRYENLPLVHGHRNRLTRLFAHLLDNAIKFRGKAAPVIDISAADKKTHWEFCVADNGIGIDPEHHDIIFRLFQRLHAANDFPGHGIGLSLARKIVLSHGGRLWLESNVGRGSRFYFTLSKNDK